MVTWPSVLRNKCITFNCDNLAIVHVINSKTSKESSVMFLLCKLVLCCLSNNILFKAYHVPRVHNLIPDKLSRSHVQEARQLAPWLDPTPTLLPESFHPNGNRFSSIRCSGSGYSSQGTLAFKCLYTVYSDSNRYLSTSTRA